MITQKDLDKIWKAIIDMETRITELEDDVSQIIP